MRTPPPTAKQRAAARAALTRSIKIREGELARPQILVPDDYLATRIEALERELGELRTKRAQMDPRKAPQLPDLAARYLGGERDPRRSREQELGAARAIERREAQEQTREQLQEIPRCPHGDLARLCPRCNAYPIEEVPF